MKQKLTDIRNCLFWKKYQSIHNTKKLCSLVGFTNLITCAIFYYWLISSQSTYEVTSAKYLLIVAVLTHTYINIVLIKWSLPFENAKWMKWVWSSLVCVSPFGVMLIYAGSNEKNWSNVKQEEKPKNTAFHSLTNFSVNLSDILRKSIEYLLTHHTEGFRALTKAAGLRIEEFESWNNKLKYLIIAMSEALKNTAKKGSTMNDMVFGAHWYDQRHFDFALKDPKAAIVPNMRYKYSFGFIVLDEYNNYQKILDGKKEIKEHMKFGPAKAVCLHWGKGFKVFVNE